MTFSDTVQCVLIPSRKDIDEQGLKQELWYDEVSISLERRDAEQELTRTMPTNVHFSTLSLYAAMNLLYVIVRGFICFCLQDYCSILLFVVFHIEWCTRKP